MIMVMRWDGVGSRCQSYLDCALGNDAIALLHSCKYLHTLAVALAKLHFLLAIAFSVNLDVDKVTPCSSVRAVRGSVMTLGRSCVMR